MLQTFYAIYNCVFLGVSSSKEAVVKTLVEGGVLTELGKALESGACPDKASQLVAEIAKVGKYVIL